MKVPLITLALSFAAFSQVKTEVPPVEPAAKPVAVEKIKIHGAALEGNLEGNAVDRDVMSICRPGTPQTRRSGTRSSMLSTATASAPSNGRRRSILPR